MEKLILQRSEDVYSFLLQFYPKRYKQEFGEEMKYVFSESLHDAYDEKGEQGIITLWTRTIIDGIKSCPLAYVEVLKGGGYMTTKSNDLLMQNKVFLWGALATALILMIPFLGRWPWSQFDFVFAATLLFGTGSAFVLIARKAKSNTYRLAVGLGLLAAFLLFWVNNAVGIIGDPEDGTADLPNLLYMGVLAIGFFGAIISRFKARGMAKTLFAAAIAQFAVPVIMLILNPQVLNDAPGLIGVFILNSFFAMMFVGSGILFKQASETKRN